MAAVHQHPQAVFKKTTFAGRNDRVDRGPADQRR